MNHVANKPLERAPGESHDSSVRMTLAEMLNTPEARRSQARARTDFERLAPAEQAQQRQDGLEAIQLTHEIADAERAGQSQAPDALNGLERVEGRLRGRIRDARRRGLHTLRRIPRVSLRAHAARPRVRSRERREVRSRRGSSSDQGDGGSGPAGGDGDEGRPS